MRLLDAIEDLAGPIILDTRRLIVKRGVASERKAALIGGLATPSGEERQATHPSPSNDGLLLVLFLLLDLEGEALRGTELPIGSLYPQGVAALL